EEVTAFVPRVDGVPFEFVLHCRDHEDRPVRLVTPLTWVAATFTTVSTIRNTHKPHETIDAAGQKVAFAPVRRGGDTVAPAASLTFDAEPEVGTSTPSMVSAEVTVDVVEQMAGVGPVTINYYPGYATGGFGGANVGEVWAEVAGSAALEFGTSEAAGSDRAGGFIQPNLVVKGLSRIQGVVNDLDRVAAGTFKADDFLTGVLPKLFGLVELTEILDLLGLDLSEAPTVISETLDRIEGFIGELQRAIDLANQAVDEANLLVQRAAGKAVELRNRADAALVAAQSLATDLENAADDVLTTLQNLASDPSLDAGALLADPLQAVRDVIPVLRDVAPELPPLIGRQLENLARVL
ncbi:MAG: hypothetical protein R3246_17135, partial [Acidimicrobiia bacterium]|nr:hypothetical protein [Acidimicrobiia bacterium]